jgi:hypothetical protein
MSETNTPAAPPTAMARSTRASSLVRNRARRRALRSCGAASTTRSAEGAAKRPTAPTSFSAASFSVPSLSVSGASVTARTVLLGESG